MKLASHTNWFNLKQKKHELEHELKLFHSFRYNLLRVDTVMVPILHHDR